MKKYRGPQTVEAELFDGTAEQAKKCGLKYGIIDLIYTSNGYKPLWAGYCTLKSLSLDNGMWLMTRMVNISL